MDSTRTRYPRYLIPLNSINYSEIARKSNLSISFISRIMRGERTPSLRSSISISEAMGISMDQLVRLLKIKHRR